MPDALCHSGRASILKRMLATAPLYPAPVFRARLEAQARANLAREITALS